MSDSHNDSMEMDLEDQENNFTMIWLLLLSTISCILNTLLYKVTLNAFSSPETNYGFFVSQFSTFLYTLQAIIISMVVIWRNWHSLKDITNIRHSVYLNMASMDAASATLGAIAGAFCPGALQTVINQMIIPVTLIGSYIMVGTRYKANQLLGSSTIVLGAVVASSDYFLGMLTNNAQESNTISDGRSLGHTATHGMSVTIAIFVYFVSMIPSAFSNIYKETQMKTHDMNEVHTSTVVSFWQLVIGFLFLPLLAIPSFGGLSWVDMYYQMGDGFQCFMGTNPTIHDDCSNAAVIFLVYALVNFFYNVLLLMITKRGSAILLVMSQALALPITNIVFSLPVIMGPYAEPMSMSNLIGIVLVCIGFLAYSGYGFAHSFLVAQGPPGQMTYLHVEGHDQVMVSASKLVNDPNELIDFLVGSLLVQFSSPGNCDRAVGMDRIVEEDEDEEDEREYGAVENNENGVSVHISALTACKRALYIVKAAASILENRIAILTEIQKKERCSSYQHPTAAHYGHLSTPEMSRRYEHMTAPTATASHFNSHALETDREMETLL